MQNSELLWVTLGLAILVLVLVVLVVLLLRNMMQTSENTRFLTTNLLLTEQNRVQTLLNQLRSGDVMTLHGLQEATNQPHLPSQGLTSDEPLTPDSEYFTDPRVEGLADEFDASGWSEPTIANSGGNPVNFDRPE